MIIKKFQGKTEADAVEQAKKELGNDVVVMNVRSQKPKGFLAFLKSRSVEVTVAKEEESETREPFAQALPSKPVPTPSSAPVPKQPAFSMADILPEEPEPPVSVKPGQAIEERLDNLQFLIEKQLSAKAEPLLDEPEKKTEGPAGEMAAFIQILYNTMIDNEVKENYVNQIVDEVERTIKPNMTIDYVLANVYQRMILKFGIPEPITAPEELPKVIFFIGPTGVGKPPTIAKIASKFAVEMKKKVVLLTADTYRIAAAEQLRTYANILDVPFRVVYAVEDVETAYRDFKGYDYILIDTAGHSYQNEGQKSAMSEFITCLDGRASKEVYLVVSATTKYRDLVKVADMYSAMTEYKLIFTKLDETSTLGNLLNLKLHTGASLSYVTYGQNVPDDI